MSVITVQRGAQRIIEEGLREESRNQGHTLTGAMEESFGAFIEPLGVETRLTGTANGYTLYVNGGVPSKRIPFAPGSGAKSSKYITGLINYWRLRGLTEEEATRAAFATAHKHKEEGMPTDASYRFSSNGQRLKLIETAFAKKERALDAHMFTGYDQLVESEFQKTKSETV
jgi:hypothetical protein